MNNHQLTAELIPTDSDMKNVDRIIIENGIVANTESHQISDFGDQKKITNYRCYYSNCNWNYNSDCVDWKFISTELFNRKQTRHLTPCIINCYG